MLLRIVHSGIYYDYDMNPLYIVGLKLLGDKLCVCLVFSMPIEFNDRYCRKKGMCTVIEK